MRNYFYNGTIKNYVIAFSQLFTDLTINHTTNGNVVSVKVPLTYTDTARYIQGTNITGYKVPHDSFVNVGVFMAYSLDSYEYDASRKTNALNTWLTKDSTGRFYNAVPYNFNFTLSITTQKVTDLLQLVEQILPYFNPYLTLRITNGPTQNLDLKLDITSVNQQIVTPGKLEEDATYECDISFSMKAWLFQDLSTNGINSNLIKKATVDLQLLNTIGVDTLGTISQTGSVDGPGNIIIANAVIK